VTEATKDQPNVPNIAFLTGTFLIALVGTPWYIIARGLRWPEVIVFVAIWLAVGISVTAGYHRVFTHKTYQATWPGRPARETAAGDDLPETRLGMIHHALEQALREWKQTLRQMNRLSTATAA
jgi:stearoyl-CoA desaturase (delta-9 desaturase)